MSYFVGVDIGGTFTDCVAIDEDGERYQAKSLSTKADPSDGVIAGLTKVAEAAGLTLGGLLASADRFSHGTTIGTNMVIEREGAKVAMLTTVGHRDALLMMRGTGRIAGLMPDDMFSLHTTDMPERLVPRDQIHEVIERVDSDGDVVVPLDEEHLAVLLEQLDAESVEAVAVTFLWSFRNEAHERRVGALLATLPSRPFVALSSDVSPRVGEFERASATAISAYLGPGSSVYLDRLEGRLRDAGLTRSFLVMQSNGGVGTAETIKREPLRLLDSGPAGGLVAVESLARRYGHENVIATDMGGTSFDVGLVVGGSALTRDVGVIDQYSYFLPHLDVTSIACGGGSIARYDEHSESIQVGPRSAGSEPGPACYGRGGTDATVTDADVVLGLVRPEAFLSGAMPLDEEAARHALGALAERLDVSVEAAAAGILRINDHRAATLIRQKSLQQGHDPRDFVLYAYGGAGPVHAFGFAPELGTKRVVVPFGNAASVLSAYGIASSSIVRHFEAPEQMQAPFDADRLEDRLGELEAEARESFAAMGYDPADLEIRREISMRYAEQYMQSLTVLAPARLDNSVADLEAGFVSEYARLYGDHARVALRALEIHHLRVRAMLPLEFRSPAEPDEEQTDPPPEARLDDRPIYWPGAGERLASAVYSGPRLGLGNRVEGPAVVELPHTSVPIAPHQFAIVDGIGSLNLYV